MFYRFISIKKYLQLMWRWMPLLYIIVKLFVL